MVREKGDPVTSPTLLHQCARTAGARLDDVASDIEAGLLLTLDSRRHAVRALRIWHHEAASQLDGLPPWPRWRGAHLSPGLLADVIATVEGGSREVEDLADACRTWAAEFLAQTDGEP